MRQRVSRVEVKVASQEAFRSSYLRDLSMGGLFVRTRNPLPLGAAVVVELSVASSSPLRLKGEVVRLEAGKGFGVRFSTVDADTSTALAQILTEHQEQAPAPTVDLAALETQLAEARGTIEAYEETVVLLRESENEVALKLEASEAARGVLLQLNDELLARVESLQAERTRLRTTVDALVSKLARGHTENTALHKTTVRLANELKTARAQVTRKTDSHEDTVGQLVANFDAEAARAAARQAEMASELATLKEQLARQGDPKLKEELQDLAGQLDDERLKSMALERALKRFVQMGGVIPPRTE